MNINLKRWIVLAAGFATLGFAGLNLLAYNHARSMMHFTTGGPRPHKPEDLNTWQKVKVLLGGVNLPRPMGHRSPASLATNCRVFAIAGPEGITLEAWYCDRGKETPLVILFHGYAAEKTSLMAEAGTILDLGASVLLVDFRGSGGSSEAYTTIGVLEAEDVTAVMRFAGQTLPHTRHILFGHSMGAAAILRAIHQHGIQPEAVILEAVYDTLLNTVRNRFRAMRLPSFPSAELLVFWGGRQWGFDGFRHNPVDYAASVRCAVLFLHGEEDSRATRDEARRVFDAVPGRKQFVVFDQSGHASYIANHPQRWRKAVAEIVR